MRAAAAHLVAMHPFPQFREKLVPLLDDKKDAVRVRAAAAYIRLQPLTTRELSKRRAESRKPSTSPPAKPTQP